MKKIAGIISVACSVSILLSVFVGCQQKPNANSSENTKESAVQEEVKLRFSWWGGDARHKAFLSVFDLYNQKNPNVKVEGEYGNYDAYVQKMLTQMAGGTAPDVMMAPYQELKDIVKRGGEFIDLYTNADGLDISGFDKDILDSFAVVDGKLQGLPPGITAITAYINTEFMKKFNIPEDIQWSWEEIVKTGKEIHEKDKNYYLINGSIQHFVEFYLIPYVNQQSGNQWIEDDYTMGFTKEMLVNGFKYIQDLVDNGVVQSFQEIALFGQQTQQNPKWINGELGIQLHWQSSIPAYESVIKWKMGVSRFPVLENAKTTSIYVAPQSLVCVSKSSANTKEAIKLLNFFMNDVEAVTLRGDTSGIPSTEAGRQACLDAGKISEINSKAVSVALASKGHPQNAISLNKELSEIAVDLVEQVGYKKITPETAAEELIKRYEQKLNELNSK